MAFISLPNCTNLAPKIPQVHRRSQSKPRAFASLPPTTNTPTTIDLPAYLTAVSSNLDAQVSHTLPLQPPHIVHAPMRYCALSNPTPLAPAVCIAVASDLFGVPHPTALIPAHALHLVHAAALMHEDMPALLDRTTRANRPTTHIKFAQNVAILTYDGLVPFAFAHIAESNLPADISLRLVAEISKAMGSQGFASGQYMEAQTLSWADGFFDKDCADQVHSMKMGVLVECGAACGGIVGGAKDEEIERLRKYGRALGIMYQILWDIKEKERGGFGKASYARGYGAERAMEVAEEMGREARKALEGFDPQGTQLLEGFADCGAAAHVGVGL
ncbi:hypothetical protein AMTR_s00003p00217250 [Amborella trichopoda]|uniref:Geranylgeranyl pyrophosphate synthase n=2 Tax=Amborella trichopoda TaxID=13333 RepID=W1P6S3_AMBTC|nr:hypothetical protein AMTR_s00003p00217250 [Amborella trichopoda]